MTTNEELAAKLDELTSENKSRIDQLFDLLGKKLDVDVFYAEVESLKNLINQILAQATGKEI